MEINVSNCQKKIRISKKWVREAATEVLKRVGINGELSMVLVDNKYIRKLNRKYRHKDRATDVLSFQQNNCMQKRGQATFSKKMNSSFSKIPLLLGDVVISVERAKSQAEEYGYTFKDEMAMLVEHGILHLLGFTHKKMEMVATSATCRRGRKRR